MSNSTIDKLWVTTWSQLMQAELRKPSRVAKDSPSIRLNDVIVGNAVLFDNTLCTRKQRQPNWVCLLNFCNFIESLILNDHVILRVPDKVSHIVMNGLAFSMVAREMGIAPNALEQILWFGIGYSARTTPPEDLNQIYIGSSRIVDDMEHELSQQFKNSPVFESERPKWRAVFEHAGQEMLATQLGCSYISGFGSGGNEYQIILSDRTEILKRLTPQRFYGLIKEAIKTEVKELKTAGWTGNLHIPPLALFVLNRCRGEKKHLGEIVLEERQKAARFREWVHEIRSELANAPSMNEAARLHKKLQDVFRDLAGYSGNESWRATSWNGLLAAFPKSVWDGLSREDVDVKSLISFLAQKPLKAIMALIRQRNYVYMLDVKSKVRHVNEYASLAKNVLSIDLSDEDIRLLREYSSYKTA